MYNQNLKKPELHKLSETEWEIPKSFKPGMRVPGRLIATKQIIDTMDAQVFEQLTNVATLPGIIRAAYCMPDGHIWCYNTKDKSGYGFPIGGVAAMDIENDGVISPGGIGFDTIVFN